jgi:hypothetical protein
MLNLPELENRLDKALENETKESLTNWINKKRNMKNQMVFFGESRAEAIGKGNRWMDKFVGYENIKNFTGSTYWKSENKGVYVCTWEKKEDTNG